MAEAERNAATRDYLTRLASLASGHTLDSGAHTAPPVVVLRPRLPSRFEAPTESAPEEADWHELEYENPHRRAPEDQEADAAPAPRRPAASRSGAEPRPGSRRVGGSEPALRAERVNAPTGKSRERATVQEERASPVLTSPPAAPLPRPRPAVSNVEALVETTTPALVESRPRENDERVRPAAAAAAPRSMVAPEAASGSDTPVREKPAAPRPILRPAPPPPSAVRDEAGQAGAPRRGDGLDAGAGAPSAAERRTAPGPPIISVTIGRIEIRAPAPPPVAPTPPPEPPRPAVSLDEYLQRRADGRY